MGIVVSVVGCQGDSRNRQAVSGTVTLSSERLDQGFIEFQSIDGGGVATGGKIENGVYQIPANQGLPPGVYVVRVRSAANAKAGSTSMQAFLGEEGGGQIASRIPVRYNTDSNLHVTVTSNGEQRFDFNLEADL